MMNYQRLCKKLKLSGLSAINVVCKTAYCADFFGDVSINAVIVLFTEIIILKIYSKCNFRI